MNGPHGRLLERECVEVLQRVGHGAVVEHEDLERRPRSRSGEQCLQTEAEQREVVVRDDDERNHRLPWMARPRTCLLRDAIDRVSGQRQRPAGDRLQHEIIGKGGGDETVRC